MRHSTPVCSTRFYRIRCCRALPAFSQPGHGIPLCWMFWPYCPKNRTISIFVSDAGRKFVHVSHLTNVVRIVDPPRPFPQYEVMLGHALRPGSRKRVCYMPFLFASPRNPGSGGRGPHASKSAVPPLQTGVGDRATNYRLSTRALSADRLEAAFSAPRCTEATFVHFDQPHACPIPPCTPHLFREFLRMAINVLVKFFSEANTLRSP